MLGRKLLSRPFASTKTLISPNRQFAQILSGYNNPGLLEKILKIYNDKHLNLFSINGRVLEKDGRGMEKCQFDISFDSNNKSAVKDVEGSLKNLQLDYQLQSPPVVDWFPSKESDLDEIGSTLQSPGDGLNQDHPGFKDKEYKKRRNKIGDQTLNYKMGTPIPRIDYAPEETALWGYIYNKVRPLHYKHGCKEYIKAMDDLENTGLFKSTVIPQLEDLNAYLKQQTNWRIKPVNGILSQREFLNCLAFRTFCSTQYIRHPSQPEYTPEPDIMHEFLGHIPNFLNHKMCDISQRLGMLSLGASDAQVAMIGAIYWFTVEFGLCREGEDIKFYGAGPGGSFGEIYHAEKIINNHRDKIYRLDIINNPVPTKFVVQDVQPFYYAADSFDNFLQQLEDYAAIYYKPFNLSYDHKNNSYESDRALYLRKPDEPILP